LATARPKFRMTRQRKVILDHLRTVTSHPTAEDVYHQVRHRVPRISLATVYRNLVFLSETGMIRKLDLAGEPMRFDGETANHYHVRCLRCGKVEDLPIEPFDIVERTCAQASNYQIVSHRLEFLGLCPQCKQHSEPEVASASSN